MIDAILQAVAGGAIVALLFIVVSALRRFLSR